MRWWSPRRMAAGNPPGIAAEKEHGSMVGNVALFLLAPFIGLVYVIALPFAGLGLLAWFGVRTWAAKVPAVESFATAAVAPFLGLAFIVATPFLGLGALTWLGAKRGALLCRSGA